MAAALVAATSFLDWAVGRNVSLAALYILPMMVGAIVMRPLETAGLALLCSYLRFCFDTAGSLAELSLRFIFAFVAYFLSGLFVTVLVRNHQMTEQHLARVQREQQLRREAEEQLRLLAESSPAAILTTDGSGTVLACNSAAEALFSIPNGQTLRGRNICASLPVLCEALRLDVTREGLRTAVQCQGYRDNGEIFLAHIWLSSYLSEGSERLAAIVVDSSEEMREREEEGLRHLVRGNRIAAAAVAHEVRNFCVAMNLLCGNLRGRPELAGDEDLHGLDALLEGLQAIASVELQLRLQEDVSPVPLKEVLDSLRIIAEPSWRDIDGTIHWQIPPVLPDVLADARGLLQAFLNLVQNSHRAVSGEQDRSLWISVELMGAKAVVRFHDSGTGVAAPDQLFQPLQQGSLGSGMGLYVSRFIVRSYGGEIRYEAIEKGSCFAVELQTA